MQSQTFCFRWTQLLKAFGTFRWSLLFLRKAEAGSEDAFEASDVESPAGARDEDEPTVPTGEASSANIALLQEHGIGVVPSVKIKWISIFEFWLLVHLGVSSRCSKRWSPHVILRSTPSSIGFSRPMVTASLWANSLKRWEFVQGGLTLKMESQLALCVRVGVLLKWFLKPSTPNWTNWRPICRRQGCVSSCDAVLWHHCLIAFASSTRLSCVRASLGRRSG